MYANGREFVTVRECARLIADYFENSGFDIDTDSENFEEACIALMRLCEREGYTNVDRDVPEDEFVEILEEFEL